MTLILSCLTPKYIVQVSDRRLMFPNGRVADDAANKAIIFHGVAALSYTGISRIGAQPTDEWLAQQLVGRSGVQDAITGLVSALNARISRLAAPNRYLTVVIDLWGTQLPGTPMRPWSVAITNYVDPKTRKQSNQPFATFEQFTQTLPENTGYALLAQGQLLPPKDLRELTRNIVRAMRRRMSVPSVIAPESVARFMQHAVLQVARGNLWVGKNLMTTILLNRELPEYAGVPSQAFYTNGSDLTPVLYGPTIVEPTMTVRGLRVSSGPPSRTP